MMPRPANACWMLCNRGNMCSLPLGIFPWEIPCRAVDKAYDADWIREMIWEQGAIAVIPSKSNRKLPKEFDAQIYKERNKIERFFGRLKASFRRIATRYEKTSQNFLAMIKLASVRLWIESYESAA